MTQPPNQPPGEPPVQPPNQPPAPPVPPSGEAPGQPDGSGQAPRTPSQPGAFGPPPAGPGRPGDQAAGPGDTPPGAGPQPPAPPNAGFGPPQPPPGPYGGAPQQPPAQPQQPGGYGHPQQPGPYGPPPQQPGPYAPTPPQQPGPYGYPQQPGPYGVPAYGYPQQPQHPGPAAPGQGGRGPFKGKPAVLIGAAVAGLLVVGAGVWAAVGRGGDDEPRKPAAQGSSPAPSASASDDPVNPGYGDGGGERADDEEDFNAGRKPGDARVLWYKQAPDAPGSGADAPGMWVAGDVVAKAAYKQVFGYKAADGKAAWKPVTFDNKICAATQQQTSAGKVVVATMNGGGSRAKCNQLQEIDLATGAKGWTAEVADGDLFDSTLQLELHLTGNTLVAGRSMSGTAYDVRTGKKLWDKKKYGKACFPSAFAGGTKLVVVSSCDASGDDEHDEVQELDPATGKARWTQRFEKGWRVSRAYSVDPLVLYSTNRDKNAWNISVLTSSGAFRSEVKVDEDFAPSCGFAVLARDLTGCNGVAADAGTLYLPTDARSRANEIVAISLDTGKEKWRVASPTDRSMVPVKVEGGKLIAYVQPSFDAGGRVVSIPTAGGGKPVTLLQHPEGGARVEGGFYSKDFDWVDGRFYLSTTRLTGNDAAREKLMLAFGK